MSGADSGSVFLDLVDVGFDDLDVGGVVYHANYLRLCDRARNRVLLRCGFDVMAELGHDRVLGVVACEQTFRRPVELGTYLIVTRFVDPSQRSITAEHAIFRIEDRATVEAAGGDFLSLGCLLFSARLRLVSGSLRQRLPCPLPDVIARLG